MPTAARLFLGRFCCREARPNGDGSKNLRLVVSNPARKPERAPPKPPKPPEVPLIVRLLALAREWQGLIDRGELRTQAELAARSGLHPYRVSNIFCLLRLTRPSWRTLRDWRVGTTHDSGPEHAVARLLMATLQWDDDANQSATQTSPRRKPVRLARGTSPFVERDQSTWRTGHEPRPVCLAHGTSLPGARDQSACRTRRFQRRIQRRKPLLRNSSPANRNMHSLVILSERKAVARGNVLRQWLELESARARTGTADQHLLYASVAELSSAAGGRSKHVASATPRDTARSALPAGVAQSTTGLDLGNPSGTRGALSGSTCWINSCTSRDSCWARARPCHVLTLGYARSRTGASSTSRAHLIKDGSKHLTQLSYAELEEFCTDVLRRLVLQGAQRNTKSVVASRLSQLPARFGSRRCRRPRDRFSFRRRPRNKLSFRSGRGAVGRATQRKRGRWMICCGNVVFSSDHGPTRRRGESSCRNPVGDRR